MILDCFLFALNKFNFECLRLNCLRNYFASETNFPCLVLKAWSIVLTKLHLEPINFAQFTSRFNRSTLSSVFVSGTFHWNVNKKKNLNKSPRARTRILQTRVFECARKGILISKRSKGTQAPSTINDWDQRLKVSARRGWTPFYNCKLGVVRRFDVVSNIQFKSIVVKSKIRP